MRHKSIAILGSRGIPARYGGFETFAEELSVRLAARGHSVTVYCESERRQAPDCYRGVTRKFIVTPRLGPLSPIVFDALCLLHARSGHDIVYVLGFAAPPFFLVPRLFGTQVWVNMDGVEWARSKWGTIAKQYIKIMEAMTMWAATRVIADAHAIRTFLAQRHVRMPPCTVIAYGAPVIRNAPDPALIGQFNLFPRSYYLVVCRLEPENHVLEILKGFARSASPHSLIIVGDHSQKSSYVRKLRVMESSRIRFIGTVYDPRMLQALRYFCLAYLHGHSVGGTNPSLLEALGCGNVVLAHDNEFNREVCGDLATYFKYADDIPARIDALDNCNPRRRTELEMLARRRIEENYSWERVTEQYSELIDVA